MSRFDVDLKGMRELQASRELWRLVKELPVNVFDEFARDDVVTKPTYCNVTVDTVEGKRRVEIVVQDDGQGFQALEDAYTLFRTTPKRGQAQVAGRFNLGEKELMAAAFRGGIETTSGTVEFPEDGSRKVNRWLKRGVGTLVWAELPSTLEEKAACEKMLKKLIPPQGLEFRVNGELVKTPEPILTTSTVLDTVIQEAPGQPMRTSWRTTDLVIYRPEEGEETWLYELGCPVQPLACAYSVDIRQKVPLPPERDTVSDRYLQDVYAAVANATAELMGEEQVADTWVKSAMEDSTITVEAVQKIVHKRHGDKVALWSSNAEANEKAMDAGYQLVSKTALSSSERQAYVKAGVLHAGDMFGRSVESSEGVEPDENMLRVAQFAKLLAEELLGIDIGVQFFRQEGNPDLANYGSGILSFNLNNAPPSWFANLRPEVTGLILHELAHHGLDGSRLPHGVDFYHSLDVLAGKLFHRMLSADSYNTFEPVLDYGKDVIGKE